MTDGGGCSLLQRRVQCPYPGRHDGIGESPCDHHCLVQGCGIEAALERIRKAYKLSKKEVKLFDQKLLDV